MIFSSEIFPELKIIEPEIHFDPRGSFREWFAASDFEQELGFPLMLAQANISVSTPGVIRGLHAGTAELGQAKYVTCVAGSVRDIIVDIRRGSPTFGHSATVELSAESGRGVFIPVGFAHGFATATGATVVYLTTAEYDPTQEFGISPLDPALALDWGLAAGQEPVLSAADAAAPTLAVLATDPRLPDLEQAQRWLTMQQDEWVLAHSAAGVEL